MSTALVSFDHVSKAFRTGFLMRSVPVVEDLCFDVGEGTICGLLGPNGAGKTTSLRLLVGLMRPDRGALRVLGREAGHPESRREMGFLPETPYFYDYLTARELLDFFGRLVGLAATQRRRRSEELLERLGIARAGDVPLRKYSKGMLQRLGLAQALLAEPRLLVLDEPMSGLDPVGRRLVRDIILAERARGTTVLFSSHILQDAELICSNVVILVAGKVRSVGALEQLLSRRVKHYELSLEGLPAGAPPEGLVEIAREGNQVLWRTRTLDEAESAIARARAAGGRVLSMTPVRDTLEDLFLEEVRGGAR